MRGRIACWVGHLPRRRAETCIRDRRKAEIESLTPQQIKVAARPLDPQALTCVVVGDLKQIEAPIRALNLGEVSIVDADGKPVAAK